MGLVPSPDILSTDVMGRVAPPIFTSVGQGGVNAPGDVFVIQSLLNDRLPKPHTPVPVTGAMDPGTVLAIQAYQAVVMGLNPPSGRVDPGSTTYYSLAARPLVNQGPSTTPYGHVGIFPREVIEAAVTSFRRWRVPVSITMAQWVVESAWGAAMPPGSNNPFGIKATDTQDGVDAATTEVVGGNTVEITARFRRFASVSEAFELHGKLLSTGGRYTAAMQACNDPEAFADALTGVYATDPQYGFKLKWVMANYGLRQYDQ